MRNHCGSSAEVEKNTTTKTKIVTIVTVCVITNTDISGRFTYRTHSVSLERLMTDVSTGLGVECSRAGDRRRISAWTTYTPSSLWSLRCSHTRSLIELAHAKHALLPHPARVLRHAEWMIPPRQPIVIARRRF